ncbi:MAG: hypothetical protein KDE09_01000 [Anaerolineales bacterium]|nr:hypothetical protein [Anaerolineales bacterium]MCB0014078.1 hypothetical protein [Anaerolineales bacterium]MCB0016330.1 hypothetical protein [Anaerolineales bacterium]MCB8962800.1 hypothetical protein [Ardenticatenales bacterium]
MQQPNYEEVWGHAFVATNCPHCDWIYLTVPAQATMVCPHCGQATLEPLTAEDELPYTRPPELLLLPGISRQNMEGALGRFANEVPYPPDDLTSNNLLGRLQLVYLPMWLVDVDVSADWQAEVGYDYEVVSHRESLRDGAWSSQEVKETRIRWELRVGQLERHYANARAAALDEQAILSQRIGEYDSSKAGAFQASALNGSFVRLPNRTPRDAWSDAQPTIQNSAAAECQRAANGQHLRQYRWAPEFARQEWTQLLLPLYTTHYEDDEKARKMVMVNGQTGQLIGSRRASTKKAQHYSIIIGLIGLALALISLLVAAAGFLAPPLFVVGGIGLFVAVLVMVGAIIPLGRAWQFNKQHAQRVPLRLDA